MAERFYAGMSAEQRTDRRREQLLAAGLEVFAVQGWAASTVQDVCRTAGLSPRYFYELFRSREDLFLAVTARVAEQVQETVRTALEGAPREPQEHARQVLAALAGYFTADSRVVRVALMESLATEQFRAHRRELLATFAALAARLMRPLRGAPVSGARARRSLELSAAVLTGGVVESLIAWDSGDPRQASDLLVDHLTDLFTAAARL